MTKQDIITLVSDSFESAKNGNAVNVYDSIAPLHDDGSLPERSHYPFGWIIYYALHQTPDGEIEKRKRMLARYLRLDVAKPHKLHSMILTEAIRLHKDAKAMSFNRKTSTSGCFSIVRFSNLWDLGNLRPGDWRRKEYEGKQTGSTVEKLITCLVAELENSHIPASADITELADKAIAEFPDSVSILSQRATLHMLAGELHDSRSLLRKAIISAPGKFFLWSRLASTIDKKKDMNLYVALLHKAMDAPGPDKFKGRIRMDLAECWLSVNAFHHALWELLQTKKAYEANGWHLPKSFTAMLDRIPKDTVASNPEPLYRKTIHLADNEIYSGLSEVVAIKTFHKNPPADSRYGRPATAWRLTDEAGTNYWIQPHRYRINPDMPNGTRVAIKLHMGKPVAARLASGIS